VLQCHLLTLISLGHHPRSPAMADATTHSDEVSTATKGVLVFAGARSDYWIASSRCHAKPCPQ
jgi:hypothetical protein